MSGELAGSFCMLQFWQTRSARPVDSHGRARAAVNLCRLFVSGKRTRCARTRDPRSRPQGLTAHGQVRRGAHRERRSRRFSRLPRRPIRTPVPIQRFNLVCLGCGPAGEKAATQAAYFNHRVAVVERQPTPGGAMVNTGTIPSKALRETAILFSSFRRRPIPGISLDIARGLSVAQFMAECHLVQIEEHDRIESSFDRQNISVYRGDGRIIDAHTVSVTAPDGSVIELKTDFILISTGSSPFRPSNIPFDHPRVVDADGILTIDFMPRSMLIVGGGVIGSEYASVFGEIGTKVTLVEPRDRILPFIDDDCRAVLMTAMESCDIDVRLNTGVEQVSPAGDREPVTVQFTDGSRGLYDLVLWASGRSGNTKDIGLENVGIQPNKRGCIDVGPDYRTNVASIFAAGDVIGPPSLTSTSMEQGRVAVCHMFGIDFKRKVAETFPIGLYTIPPVAMVGMTESDARQKGVEIVVGRAPYRLNSRGRMYRINDGLLKLVFNRASRELIGAVMVGEQSTELIHVAQCAIASNQGIDYFINACFNYPSIAELYKYAVYNALQAAATAGETAGHPGSRAKAA
jgi:NAD(P) transhydrogenase